MIITKMKNKRIEYIIDEILDQYAYADEYTRPWIIGFSGGKDSTVLLMLVWIALEKLKEQPVADTPKKSSRHSMERDME